MLFVRYVFPALVVAAGQVVLLAGNGEPTAVEGWGLLTGAGVAIFLINLFFRIGVSGERERDLEDEARAYFDRHGHWPDERPDR